MMLGLGEEENSKEENGKPIIEFHFADENKKIALQFAYWLLCKKIKRIDSNGKLEYDVPEFQSVRSELLVYGDKIYQEFIDARALVNGPKNEI